MSATVAVGDARAGLAYGLAAYGLWGVMPLYFSLLKPHLGPLEMLAHRIVWGLVFLAVVLTLAHRWGEVADALRAPRTRSLLALSTALVAVNWFVFLYAVTSERVVESSLGYFTNPLVSIALGVLYFRERLRPAQWVGLALAVAGVAYWVAALGNLPWISLTLAFSFGLYGLVRKVAPVDGLAGLTVETLFLAPLAGGYLAFLAARGEGALAGGDAGVLALLLASGALTAVPLICFGMAARRLHLSTLGFLQYFSPSLQLLQAVVLLGETVPPAQMVSFGLIWVALAVVTADSVLARGAR